MEEARKLGMKLSRIESALHKLKIENKKTAKIADDIKKAFAKERRADEQILRRLDDVEDRLGKIESGVGLLRADMARASSRTKAGGKSKA